MWKKTTFLIKHGGTRNIIFGCIPSFLSVSCFVISILCDIGTCGLSSVGISFNVGKDSGQEGSLASSLHAAFVFEFLSGGLHPSSPNITSVEELASDFLELLLWASASTDLLLF